MIRAGFVEPLLDFKLVATIPEQIKSTTIHPADVVPIYSGMGAAKLTIWVLKLKSLRLERVLFGLGNLPFLDLRGPMRVQKSVNIRES